ncbi:MULTISPECIES: hypothetical protein [unclassified Halorubrum]|uniref:hypothetical protein n=1 Tax=unclassified Halorubrum TaxID=2642239 RepID=UPI0018F3B1EE|nr:MULTISPECIES: hypothetical protein [unclassified Halorubrum]
MDEDIEGDAGSLDIAALEEIRAEFRALDGLVDHAQQYDWDAIAEQAETAYQRAIDRTW